MDEKKLRELIEQEIAKFTKAGKNSSKQKIKIEEPIESKESGEVDDMNANNMEFKELLKEMDKKTNEAVKNSIKTEDILPNTNTTFNEFQQLPKNSQLSKADVPAKEMVGGQAQPPAEKKEEIKPKGSDLPLRQEQHSLIASDLSLNQDFHEQFMRNIKDLESNMENLAKEIESFENMEKQEIEEMEREKDKDKLLVKQLVEKRNLLEINGPVFISVRRYREVVDLTQKIGGAIYKMQEMANRILETKQESVRDLEIFVEAMKEMEEQLSTISEIMKLS